MVFRHIDGRLYAGDFDCIEMGDWGLIVALTDGYRTLHEYRTEPIEQFTQPTGTGANFKHALIAIYEGIARYWDSDDRDVLVCSEDGEQLVTAVCAAVWHLHSDDSFEQSVTKATCGFQYLDDSYKSAVRDVCEKYKHSHD